MKERVNQGELSMAALKNYRIIKEDTPFNEKDKWNRQEKSLWIDMIK